ncbi:Reverse transcriptase family member [Operophtera brumata]|uniref:Reverse transcriptase family member n=1 Tax=Operophtera brumata TaxID=104452 RepID=A0A0L7LMQ0_OPEBR|nr:Reverse transcriptase family member [Operophtera brumata]
MTDSDDDEDPPVAPATSRVTHDKAFSMSEAMIRKNYRLTKPLVRALIEEIRLFVKDANRASDLMLEIKICDADLYIINVNALFPGSTHDSYIWNQSAVQPQCFMLTLGLLVVIGRVGWVGWLVDWVGWLVGWRAAFDGYGHVQRSPVDHMAKLALDLPTTRRGRGIPPSTWLKTVEKDLKEAQSDNDFAQDRAKWRKRTRKADPKNTRKKLSRFPPGSPQYVPASKG